MSAAFVNNSHDLIKILRATNRVVALFYASWCPFCARFLPIFKKHAAGEGRHFVSVQDDQETIADQYSVKVYPTVLFFEMGSFQKDWMEYRESVWTKNNWQNSLIRVRCRNVELKVT